MNKDNSEYEIDRELTGKFAIEKNAEYQDRIAELEEENKKLKEDVDYFRQCYLDLKKLCEKEGFMLSDEEITKMFDLDKIK